MIAAVRQSPILSPDGQPFMRPQVRKALAVARQETRRSVHGTYDAARPGGAMENWWANADRFDADSANSRGVRETLVSRSRYEIGNNGYADGIAQTYATDLIGDEVPLLRMETASAPLNRFIELRWYKWCQAIKLRMKLWCMAHAKLQDGEGLAIIRANRRVRHPIKLDIELIETEMCQTPWLPLVEPGYIDGIRFDRFGEPIWYDILRYHPGATQWHYANQDPERVPAELVCHWFKLKRPGQHRGIPELASSLNTGAAGRRFRNATIAAAETAAEINVLLKTQQAPEEAFAIEPMSVLDFEHKMMTALPDGWDASQMKSEHPTANYESFMRGIISEQARPKSMPYNKAACDSSSYNYASGRLDHQTYYAALNTDRADCNDQVLTPLFRQWLWEAGYTYGLLGRRPDQIDDWDNFAALHSWRWSRHQVADIKAEAAAQDQHLKNGTLTLTRAFEEQGLDFEEELVVMAADFGKTVDEMREILLASVHNANHEQTTMQEATATPTQPSEDDNED